jgi:2-keto-4-pentenoate hydratase/2-oxohepta-3-ene-1,7-dioic acid hydratase in catechol pathway
MTSRPTKVIGVGRNYAAHAAEMGNDVPAAPLIFLKPPSCIIADGNTIRLPAESKQVEFEGEIGIVIGARAHNVTERDVPRVVRAVAAFNDVTARDLQRTDSQWARAKGFDTFGPMGPEQPFVGDWSTLTLVTRVNGAERQRSRADLMVFPIPRLVAYISSIMTLEPGDIVATGTPAGVGPLKEGDTVEVEVQGSDGRTLSRVRNPVQLAE